MNSTHADLLEPEQFQAWKDNPVTQAVFHLLAQRSQAYKDSWANAEFIHDQAQNAVAVGYCKAVTDVMNVNLEEVRSVNDE